MTTLKTSKPNRREFLYYLGGASLMLLGAGRHILQKVEKIREA
ncbi:MAG: hypothetical protein ABI690_25170 [Chloroflexota bacterium]